MLPLLYGCRHDAAYDWKFSNVDRTLSANTSGLRQQRAGRSSGLPGPSTAVRAERGCATDVSSASIQPHHQRACLPLYWLRVPERVRYKIAVLVYKVLHGLAPQYPGPLNYVADLPGRRPLRRLSWHRHQPTGLSQLLVHGHRTMVTSSETLSIFRQRLKTHLFTKSFFWLFPGLHLTSRVDLSLSSGPSNSLYYLCHFKNSTLIVCLIDWLIDWLIDYKLRDTCLVVLGRHLSNDIDAKM